MDIKDLDGKTRYRTSDGRTVYVVHTRSEGWSPPQPWRPVLGGRDNEGCVRVEYVGEGDAYLGFGWEKPDDLTTAD